MSRTEWFLTWLVWRLIAAAMWAGELRPWRREPKPEPPKHPQPNGGTFWMFHYPVPWYLCGILRVVDFFGEAVNWLRGSPYPGHDD